MHSNDFVQQLSMCVKKGRRILKAHIRCKQLNTAKKNCKQILVSNQAYSLHWTYEKMWLSSDFRDKNLNIYWFNGLTTD